MGAADNVLTLLILGGLGMIIYLKWRDLTITEFVRDIREAAQPIKEE